MAQERAPNLKIPASETLEVIRGKIKETLIKIIPPNNIDIEEEKKEIWKELSIVYFKYDDEVWRQAFRKVMIELMKYTIRYTERKKRKNMNLSNKISLDCSYLICFIYAVRTFDDSNPSPRTSR
jgi:hypothetical protein